MAIPLSCQYAMNPIFGVLPQFDADRRSNVIVGQQMNFVGMQIITFFKACQILEPMGLNLHDVVFDDIMC